MIQYLIILSPVILPALFWVAYHHHVDRRWPEPPAHLLLAFMMGVGSFYLGLFLYQALDLVGLRHDAYYLAEASLPGLLAYCVLVIGPIEELAKLIPFALVVLWFREFDEPLDGIIYASFIALGFAAVENVLYLGSLSRGEAYARGFAGPVVHIVFASIWGYYLGRARLRADRFWLALVSSLACAALLHGLYDFVVIGLPSPGLPIAALLVTSLWIWRLFLIRDLHAHYDSAR